MNYTKTELISHKRRLSLIEYIDIITTHHDFKKEILSKHDVFQVCLYTHTVISNMHCCSLESTYS